MQQLVGIAEVAGGGGVIPLRVVAPQGQDVLDARFLQRVQLVVDALPVGGDTGQVGQGGDPLGLDDLGDLGGIGRSPAARAVGHAHKIGL